MRAGGPSLALADGIELPRLGIVVCGYIYLVHSFCTDRAPKWAESSFNGHDDERSLAECADAVDVR